MKKFISTMMVACMALSMVVNASDISGTKIGLGTDIANNENGQPRYISTCSGGGKHAMEGKGFGRAIYGSAPSTDVRINGTASQCKLCNLVLITQNNPFQIGVTWGNYATWSLNEQLPSNIILYTTSFSYTNNNADPYVQGFTFGRGRVMQAE